MKLLLATMVFFLAGFDATTAHAGRDYDHYLLGNAGDVVRSTTNGTVLMGGGTDVDAAFEWMIGKSGGGDFVVIRSTGTDAYNPYIYGLGTLDSVETLVLKTRRAASDPFVLSTIRNAEAVFIAGGDQGDYIRLWKGTPIEDALQDVIAKRAPIGGTSAGLAVLGEFIFSASRGTVYSDEALANPYNRYMTLDRDFLAVPFLESLITDSHFDTSDRMGRLITFLARLVQDGWTEESFGIGVDEATAILVDQNGIGTLAGSGSAYFLRTPSPPQVCQRNKPLTFLDVSVCRLSGSSTFDLANWQGSGGTSYSITAERGRLTSTQPGGEIY
ncbi:MAG: cyanophycinase [Chthoniobacterales bacterium]|nr:cyanophycinase [Chthoniobacterales bacterium]